MGIATSNSRELIETMERVHGLTEYIGCILTGSEVRKGKPAPDIYLDTARRLGVEPAECIVLEDSENGSIAAVSAGMICVGLKNPDSGNQNLERARVVISSLQEFTTELIRNLSEG